MRWAWHNDERGPSDTWGVRVTRGRWAWHNDEGGPSDTWDVGG